MFIQIYSDLYGDAMPVPSEWSTYQKEIHKIPKFRVNQASFDWDTAI